MSKKDANGEKVFNEIINRNNLKPEICFMSYNEYSDKIVNSFQNKFEDFPGDYREWESLLNDDLRPTFGDYERYLGDFACLNNLLFEENKVCIYRQDLSNFVVYDLYPIKTDVLYTDNTTKNLRIDGEFAINFDETIVDLG